MVLYFYILVFVVVFVLVAVFGFSKLSMDHRSVGMDKSKGGSMDVSSNPSSVVYNIDYPNVYQDSVIIVDLHSSYEVDPTVCYIIAHITIKLDGIDSIKVYADKPIEDYLITPEKGTNPEPEFHQDNNMLIVGNLEGKEIGIDICFYPRIENTYNTNLKIS